MKIHLENCLKAKGKKPSLSEYIESLRSQNSIVTTKTQGQINKLTAEKNDNFFKFQEESRKRLAAEKQNLLLAKKLKRFEELC